MRPSVPVWCLHGAQYDAWLLAPTGLPFILPVTHPDPAIARTLARHPRPLGGDTARNLPQPAISLTGMVLNNADQAQQVMRIGRKPEWLRARVPGGEGYLRLKGIIDEHRLHTVCQEASCPNMGECWSRGSATIMILGDTCTRSCGFKHTGITIA